MTTASQPPAFRPSGHTRPGPRRAEAAASLFDEVWPSEPTPVAGWRPWRLLSGISTRLAHMRPAPPSQLRAGCPTTVPWVSRGRALRAAHRTLQAHLQGHPALPQLLPHLAAIERKIAKRGSQAFDRLPLPVLQRALQQLTLLQGDDTQPTEAANLRVLRLRLMEAITLRSAPPEPPLR